MVTAFSTRVGVGWLEAHMRLSYLGPALLLFLGVVLPGQSSLGQADAQPPAASVQSAANRPQADKDLPSDFIDSRPILAHFDSQPMQDTVRGLLEELRRPDRCGQAAQLRPNQACALVFYKLDDEFTPAPLRPPLIMRAVYRLTDPENPAHTVMTMPNGKGDLRRYTDGDLFEPLRNIRANICRQDNRMPDQCRATESKGVLYRPFGILGNLENDREGILPAKSASKHFSLNLKPADAEWLKEQQIRDLCGQKANGKPLLVC
jgi:hypothetical protein